MNFSPREVAFSKSEFYDNKVELVRITLPDGIAGAGDKNLTGVRRGSTVSLLMEAGHAEMDKLLKDGCTVEPCFVVPVGKLSTFLESIKEAVKEAEQETGQKP